VGKKGRRKGGAKRRKEEVRFEVLILVSRLWSCGM
jgi:hypothetical protein